MTADTAQRSKRPLFRNRDFTLLWGGAACTTLGAQVTILVYPLLVLWAGGTASSAGLVTGAALLPYLLVQLPAGAIADRYDRRRLMIISDAGCLVATTSVMLAVFLDRVWLPHLMLAAFAQGSLAIFYDLAERPAVKNLVEEHQVPAALSQNEARHRAMMMLGQPLGGFLLSVTRWVPFLFTALAHLASLLMLLAIRKKFQGERAAKSESGLWADMAEGVAWLWRQTFLRNVMILVAISNLVFEGMSLALMVVIRDSGGSPTTIGVVVAIGGVGGLLGAMTSIWWRRRISLPALIVAGLAAWAACVPPLALITNPVLLGVVFAACGYIGGVFNVAGGVYMVGVAPDRILSRTISVAMLIGAGASFLGAAGFGFALDTAGVGRTVLVMTVLMGCLALVALILPSVRAAARTREGGRLSAEDAAALD
ncbi:MFS transporter [Nonomuraea sp. FMUSA5-5]|uniref:MFS transporter n=1 Tax=Nonomuraea composti TaxID=2720023 RepID=A0ABX1BIQ0_9ACTN|nr:MFS transporter [Nonomuraea sp. FMUSA5-5]NJP96367.1 MFS transporter [Nonomuraea sp. FMUSA5-5]